MENAKADVRFWEMLHGLHADRAEGNKGMTAKLARNIAEDEVAAATAADRLKVAVERVAKVERGEDAAIGKPMTRKKLIKALGMTAAELRHCARLAKIGEDAMPEILAAGMRASTRAERTAVRTILARQSRSGA